ncbi:MAG: TetR/AcrR family transcriptional regulator [Myxococcales bacterium]|nr:TetR/AcrR family transcriptional regulator [Myxococcales bacterium]
MSRFRREDWLELGLRVLGDRGPDGLTVRALCEAAGRTRGSLYHHFADHDALLSALVEHWAQRDTQALIDAVGTEGDARTLNDLALALDLDVEVGMRRLAAKAEWLRAAVGEVDQARIAFLTALHRPRHGGDAQVVARVEYAAFLGFQQLEPRPSAEEMRALYRRFEELIRREG